jgi:hypothetical protein
MENPPADCREPAEIRADRYFKASIRSFASSMPPACAGDSACAPRLQHARVVSLGQHEDSSRTATLKSVFKQRASATNIGLPEQCVCPS